MITKANDIINQSYILDQEVKHLKSELLAKTEFYNNYKIKNGLISKHADGFNETSLILERELLEIDIKITTIKLKINQLSSVFLKEIDIEENETLL